MSEEDLTWIGQSCSPEDVRKAEEGEAQADGAGQGESPAAAEREGVKKLLKRKKEPKAKVGSKIILIEKEDQVYIEDEDTKKAVEY